MRVFKRKGESFLTQSPKGAKARVKGAKACYLWRVALLRAMRHTVTCHALHCYVPHVTPLRAARNNPVSRSRVWNRLSGAFPAHTFNK